MSAPDQYYLQDSRGLAGNNVMFWRKEGKGYGTNLDDLETYTLERAQRQHDRRESDVPLLKLLVDELSVMAVDCQYLPEPSMHDENDECIVQVKGNWNGNDIMFLGRTEDEARTYSYEKAAVFRFDDADPYHLSPNDFAVFSKAAMDKVARRTFQACNINARKMITGGGIKFHKPKRVRPITGKTRSNCPECRRITWSYDPHVAAFCLGCN